MARILVTFDSTLVTIGTISENGNSTGFLNNGTVKSSLHNITQLNDEDGSDNEFTVGESLKATHYNDDGTYGGVWNVTYEGTVEFNGVKYPVISHDLGSDTIWWVVGLRSTDTENTSLTSNIATNHVNESFSATGQTICFFPGTLIATPSGERRVEDLVPGDPILIGDAGSRSIEMDLSHATNAPPEAVCSHVAPLKWLGRQTISTRFGPAKRLTPVRFAAGSLGGGGGATPSAA